LGQGSIRSFLKNKKEIQDSENIRVLGVPSDSLTYLYFNNYSSKFKNPVLRRWISKKIREDFDIPRGYSDLARKTSQYFPPESIAYLTDKEMERVFSEQPSDILPVIPEEIIIHTFTSVYDVTIEELVKKLEQIPGLKITIKADIKPSDYILSMKQGKFDIFLNIMSTDIRTPVEAINFEYFSTDSNLADLTGNIKSEFLKYQDTSSKEDEKTHMKAISRQMILDGQVIPLFHSAIPFIYDSQKVSLSGLSHLFVMNFWKMKTI
jgi:MarR-like DNA-binding transcriptional regulator SgrR of sgrS sRNA